MDTRPQPRIGLGVDPVARATPREAMATTTTLPPPEPTQSRLGVLRHGTYRLVWCTALASSIGTWMETVGVQWIVARDTRSPLVMGVLALAQLGPMLLLGLVGGVVADRVNRRTLLLVTQSVLMLVACVLALASYEGWATPRVLVGLVLLNGTAAAFNIPAWQVLTPRLVPRAELARAIALNSMQFNLARVVGPALAGILLAASGPTVLFVINALSFAGMVLAVWRTPDAPAPPGNAKRAVELVMESLRFVVRGTGPRALLMGELVFAALAAPVLRMLALFVGEVYEAKEGMYGTMLALMGVGAVAGGLALRLVPAWYPRHHLIPLAVVACGVSVSLFAVAPTPALGAAPIMLVGMFWLWCFSSFSAAVHLLVNDEMRGRVMSIYNTVVFGAMPLGSMAVALVGEGIARGMGHGADAGLAVQSGVALAGVLLAGAGLTMLVWRTPEIDGLTPEDPGGRRNPGLLRGITGAAHRPTARPEATVPAYDPPE